MSKKRKATHGGDRVLTGVYLKVDETERYEEACAKKGVTKSAQGRALLNAWTNRVLGK